MLVWSIAFATVLVWVWVGAPFRAVGAPVLCLLAGQWLVRVARRREHPLTGLDGQELRRYFALLSLVVLAWFGTLELRGLFIPDEGRYAEIPREMLASGDWVTPRLNDLKYFEKPPLQYWLTAASYRFFGEDEWTARLPSALLGFFALLMLGFTGYRLWGGRAGLLAASVMGGSWGYFLAGQYLTLDMSLTACLSVALCAFLLAQTSAGERSMRSWMLAAWAAAALAMLAKGLIGIALPGLALAAYTLMQRDLAVWRRLEVARGSLLFVLVAAPWFVLVQWRNPEFFDFFFVQEHFGRFVSEEHHRLGPWWYYAPILLLGFLPWTPALMRDAPQLWRAARQSARGFSPHAFLLAWAGVIVVFFSMSRSKLPAYILPAFPAMALLFAHHLRHGEARGLRWSAWGAVLIGAALALTLLLLPRLGLQPDLLIGAETQHGWLLGAALLLSASGGAALWLRSRSRQIAPVLTLAIGTLVAWNLVFAYLHDVDSRFSAERLIESVQGDERPFAPKLAFYSVGQFDHSVPFYLGRPVTLVGIRSELSSGIAAEPGKAIPNLEQFFAIWRAHEEQAYAVLRPSLLARLRPEEFPAHELASDGRLVIVSRFPAGKKTAD